jgi:methylmalonyl-CoA/ethylmalonyl-CoA epimerase
VELLEGTGPESAIAKFIEKRGGGIHHLCFDVSDIERALETLSEKDIRLIDTEPRPGAEGNLVAFIHPGSTGKVLIELEQK